MLKESLFVWRGTLAFRHLQLMAERNGPSLESDLVRESEEHHRKGKKTGGFDEILDIEYY